MSCKHKVLSLHICFFILFFFAQSVFVAQNNFSSEGDLKKQANKLFENEDYTAAYPLYSQLVSIYPKDPEYNYKLGVCMLYSGGDREKPIQYLEFASQKKEVDKEVFFYLGKAYHLNYRFDNAITAYNNFKKAASKAQIQKLEVDQQIAMCNNGKTLLKNITDLVVLDKKELSEAEFFRSYDLSGIGGKLLVKPDDFKSPVDKKKKEKSIVYLSKKNDQIFYSSYGQDGKRGRDIYVIKKQPNGEWSQPQALPSNINTEFDEDYPFLHPNGKSLYFSSKGHNSMGGYDIFKSTYDEATNTWSNPVNLDFAINTPDDDILYVTDSLEKTAYFSSNRLSANGMIAVFKIKVDRKPVDVSIINGTFVKAGDDKRLDAKITVKNIDKNELVGIFNTNGADGIYSLQLPNGGNFLFTVESDGYNSQSETVVVPAQKELRPLKQTISYEAGTGKLIITNYFDEPVSESNYLLALNLIKEKAKLEVNASGPELFIGPNSNSLDTSGVDNGEIKASSNKKLSNDDLVSIAKEDAEDVQKDAKDLRAEADMAKSIADKKNQEAQDKSKEADQLLSNASTIQDQSEKQTQIDKGNALKKESESLSKETVVAYNLAKKLDDDAISKQEEADLSTKYAKDLESAVKSGNSKDALTKLDAQKNKLEEIDKQPVGTDNAYQSIKKDIDNKQKQIDKLSDDTRSIYQEIPQLEEDAKKLRSDAENTKKDDLKQGMLDQAKEIDDEIVQKKKQAADNDVKIKQLEGETETLKTEAELVNKLIGEIKTESGTTSGTELASKSGNQNSANIVNNNPSTPPVKTIETSVNYPDKYSKELSDAEKIPDQYDREIAKADANKQWADAIKKDIAKKKEQIKTAKTPAQKQALTKQVNQLNQQLKEKEKAQQESTEKAEQIKQQPVAQNNPTQAKDSSAKTINLADYTQNYESQLKDTAKITSPYEKEVVKAKANKEYADAIDRSISDKKEDLASNNDPQAKIVLQNQVSDLEKQSQEKRKLAEESSAKADQLKSQEGIAQNTSASTTPANTSVSSGNNTTPVVATIETAVDYSDKYSKRLTDADSIPNEYDRELAKADANKQWADAINKDITKKKNQLKTAKTPGQKQALTNKINQLQQQLKEKETSEKASTAKAQEIKQQELAVANHSTQPNDTVEKTSVKAPEIKQPENLTNADNTNTAESLKTAQITADKNTSPPKALGGEYVYTSTEAAQQVTKIQSVMQEANDLKNQASAERKAAESISNPVEKNKKLNEASDLENKSDNKLIEADKISVEANKSEFANNDYNIDELVKKAANNKANASNLSSANDLRNESNLLFAQALKLSGDADKVNDVFKKKEMLDNANDQEIQALEKQKQVKEDYAKYYSEPAAASTTNTTSQNNYKTLYGNGEDVNANPSTNVSANDSNKKTENDLSSNPLFEANKQNQQPSTVNSAKLEEIKSKKEFKDFSALRAQAEASLKDAKNQYKMAEELRATGEDQIKQSQELLTQADGMKDENKKQQTYEKAIKLANEAKLNLAKSDSIYEFAKNAEAEGNSQKEESKLILQSVDKETADGMLVLVGEKPAPTEPVEDKKDESASNPSRDYSDVNIVTLDIPKKEKIKSNDEKKNIVPIEKAGQSNIVLSPSESYSVSSKSIYSSANPIPLDQKLPDGLIFKVQLGAFKNAIPQDLFKGISPITGETTPQGFIRYSVGIFVKFENADAVKKEVKGMGYKDAFVVAFYNGKRIPINDALRQIGRTDLIAAASSNDNQNTAPIQQENTAKAENNKPVETANQAANGNSEIESVKADNVTNVNGLFYTVQVGVYSRNSKAAKLKTIKPLYKENLPNGNIRFTTGKYNDISFANISRNSVVLNNGIKDAFVTAYYNGKRISIAEAKQKQNAPPPAEIKTETKPIVKNKPIEPENTSEHAKPVVTPTIKEESKQQPEETNSNSVTTNPQATPSAENNATSPDNRKPSVPFSSDSGVVFRIQIGSFKGQVPNDLAGKYLKIAKLGIKNYKDENGLTVYTVGNARTIEEANSIKQEAVDAGIQQAFVIAFYFGQKIAVDDATKMLNK